MMKKTELLYEDAELLVCHKPAGMATQSARVGTMDVENFLKNHIYRTTKKQPYLAVIHRLDQPVEGILVFAKTPDAAKKLNHQLQRHQFRKDYRALVSGTVPKENDTLTDYLVKDAKTNTSAVCTEHTPGAKKAVLKYHIVSDPADTQTGSVTSEASQREALLSAYTQLEIHLQTGRHHQIRVQLAHLGCPILGDIKYDPEQERTVFSDRRQIALCAFHLEFRHPKTKKQMSFTIEPFCHFQ